MRKIRYRLTAVFASAFMVAAFAGCELFSGDNLTPNVTIDLGRFYGSERALTPPEGISMTSIRITVYGDGMSTITKTVSPGARYINMYVPAGPERRFKIEVFFNIISETFPYTHLRSYIGRATADLSPGRIARLVFNMAAGSTIYLVPDCLNGGIYYAPDFTSFDPDFITLLGAAGSIYPADIEISARGTIYSANYVNAFINYADNIYGLNRETISTGNPAYALAMDRNAQFDINKDKITDTSILYFSTSAQRLFFTVVDTIPTEHLELTRENRISNIYGLAVDPWTHRLYIAGVCDNLPAIIVYDPFYSAMGPTGNTVYGRILSVKTDPRFRHVSDVTVTDTAVFVLNPDFDHEEKVPSILKFDRDLNFIREYGAYAYEGSTAPGRFYYPIRFLVPENDGLTILDDSDIMDPTEENDYDKLIRIDEDLNPSTWRTYPQLQEPEGPAGEFFHFFYPN